MTLLLILILSLCVPNVCYASTTQDLYAKYNQKYVSSLSSNVTDIIQKGEHVKIDAVKYNNILQLHKPHIDNEKLKKKVDSLEYDLLASGQASYVDILRRESEYLEALKQYKYTEDVNKRITKRRIVSINSVSLNDYNTAVKTLEEYESAKEIGSISDNCPVKNYTNVIKGVDTTTYILYEPTQILVPYNSRVTSISDNVIELSLPDNIQIRIKGIDQTIVQKGEYVYQKQIIGVARGTKLIVGIKLNNKMFGLE